MQVDPKGYREACDHIVILRSLGTLLGALKQEPSETVNRAIAHLGCLIAKQAEDAFCCLEGSRLKKETLNSE